MKVDPPRDIRPFVMYCVNGKPRSSLLIESTDSMIIYIYIFQNGRRARAINALRANVYTSDWPVEIQWSI